jgi:hypothetical protein
MPFHRASAVQKEDFFSPPPSGEEPFSPIGLLTSRQERIEERLKAFIGIPYRWGGSSIKGMDCSGLVQYVYLHFMGVELPHNAAEQAQADSLRNIPAYDRFVAGDLIFFGLNNRGIDHVGIYLSDDTFLHASRRGGVRISSLKNPYWKARFFGGKRLKESNEQEWSREYLISEMPGLSTSSAAAGFQGHIGSFGLGIHGTLLSSPRFSLNMSPFLQMTFSGELESGAEYIDLLDDGYGDFSVENVDFEMQKGFRISATLAPLDWLRITPSWTQLSGPGRGRDTQGGDSQSHGLDMTLRLPESNWALTISARSDKERKRFNWPSGSSANWNDARYSLGLHLNISDLIGFSFTNIREYDSDSLFGSPSEESDVTDYYGFKVNLPF